MSSSISIWQSRTSASLEWALWFSIGSLASWIEAASLIGELEAWEYLGRVESGSEHEVVEQEDGRFWSWQGSLDNISVEFFTWFSIGSILEVTKPFLITLIEVSSLERESVVSLF